MPPDAIEPFRIAVSDADVEDLKRRLAAARWPEPLEDDDWAYGMEQGALRRLAEYWAEGYDWRRHEAALNAVSQFTTEIDGCRLHFLHVRSPRVDAIPLVISHGWPGSIVEFQKLIGPLVDPAAHGGDAADAFHVVCPSLPGYGFSTPRNLKGWDPARIGRAFAALMDRLGYGRYGAQGGDWGSIVSQAIARQDPEHCFAIHLNFLFAPPSAPEHLEGMTPREKEQYAGFRRYVDEESGYAQIQATKPQTLGYALGDSPLGQLAWIAEKFRAWTDCDGVIEKAISRDELLTNVSLYWFTGTGASSGRLYREARVGGDPPIHPYLETPVGHACFPKEVFTSPRAWVEKLFNIVHWTDMPRGGHFAALEQPELLVDDIRSFFRRWR